MLEFQKITPENFKECVKLEVEEGQKKFVASNLYSIAQAGVWVDAEAFAIYDDKIMVGFIMFVFDKEKNAGSLWRLMIAGEYQRKGYGKTALLKMIDYYRNLEGCEKVFLSYVPGNESAEKLYRFVGFKATGDIDNGEIVMEIKL